MYFLWLKSQTARRQPVWSSRDDNYDSGGDDNNDDSDGDDDDKEMEDKHWLPLTT